jgi:hypothetical protein
VFDRVDLDVYPGRRASGSVAVAPARVEAQCYRVPVSTGQEASLENREKTLRDSAGGVVHPASEDRGYGQRMGRGGMLEDAAEGRCTAVRGVRRDRLAGFVGGADRALLVIGGGYCPGWARSGR